MAKKIDIEKVKNYFAALLKKHTTYTNDGDPTINGDLVIVNFIEWLNEQ